MVITETIGYNQCIVTYVIPLALVVNVIVINGIHNSCKHVDGDDED